MMDHHYSRRNLIKGAAAGAVGMTAFSLAGRPTWVRAQQAGLDYAKAAESLKGVEIGTLWLDRIGYDAAIKMLPEFQDTTGIKVNVERSPYEASREKLVLDFTGQTGQFDVVLIDVVWIGEFAASGWLEPFDTFTKDQALADPALNLEGFFPILLESFGSWDKKVYGYPFDNYSGLLFYNQASLDAAGMPAPPKSWTELKDSYGPKLKQGGKFAYTLQSRRGETQSADSFMRVVWAFGGSLLKPDSFEPNLSSKESMAGLQFRQDLNAIMPPGVVERDHEETVQALAQGEVGMITEWSANWGVLSNPESSKIVDTLKVGVEPAGPTGKPSPALGGFSLGVNAQSSDEKKKAAYLLIQWLTSEAKAKEYIQNGGVSGRQSPYQDAALQQKYPFFKPLVESWQKFGNPIFRPRFPEWPRISEIIAEVGSEMQLGNVSVQDGVKDIEGRMKEELKPYYDGDKPKLQ